MDDNTFKEALQDNSEFNNEPVVYCKHCLSLAILQMEGTDISYCDKCGCTDVEESSISEWSELYKQKYGDKYLKRSKDGK